jgi:hypothetical protein
MSSLSRPRERACSTRLFRIDAIDSYMTRDTDNSIFDEPSFINTFNNDLNGFLKWEQLGKSEASTPRLRQLLSITKAVMGSRVGGGLSLRDRMRTVLYPEGAQ